MYIQKTTMSSVMVHMDALAPAESVVSTLWLRLHLCRIFNLIMLGQTVVQHAALSQYLNAKIYNKNVIINSKI